MQTAHKRPRMQSPCWRAIFDSCFETKNCYTLHTGCKIAAWLGTSCQETICVTAFNNSLFCSPYAYGTAAKVTKNFAFVQIIRTPDGLCYNFVPLFIVYHLKNPFSWMTSVSRLENKQTSRCLWKLWSKAVMQPHFFFCKNNGCKCIFLLIPDATAVVNTACCLRVCDGIWTSH